MAAGGELPGRVRRSRALRSAVAPVSVNLTRCLLARAREGRGGDDGAGRRREVGGCARRQ